MFDLYLLCILLFLVFVAFIFCNFLNFGYLSKTSLKKLEIAKKNKNEKCTKKGHFDKSS